MQKATDNKYHFFNTFDLIMYVILALMNTINPIETQYLRASRTIETLFVANINKVVYVYNYEGNHFRVFAELNDLIQFFQFGVEPKLDFSSELELDNFLADQFV